MSTGINFEKHAERIWGNARLRAMGRESGDAMQAASNISRIAGELEAASKGEAVILLQGLVLAERDNLTLRLQKSKAKAVELADQIAKLSEEHPDLHV